MVRRSTRIPLAVLTGTMLVFGPVVVPGQAEPTAASSPLAFERSLRLAGAVNARDIGGYRTIDGRTVRTGVVYRADQLNKLTPADLAELSRRQVREIDDLRTVYERALAPDRVPTGAHDNWYDVVGETPLPQLMSSLAGGPEMYRAFITAPGANRAVAAVLRDVIDNGRNGDAVLFHCTAGKDRTGWVAAVLLTLLGVDRDTVVEDYLLSNHYRGADPGDLLGGVDKSWLEAAFDQATATYGGFERYVRDGLRLSAADIAALREVMLV
ncbi:tyrosine-protein phosphatase [Nocardia paucivorans]|uniref:tyrosine-protein phosphatase n=1 Tax=Nocardia paucivorans TaxID=114259 RepID=UPI00030D56BF|nr:tyrosine-protein phosphatase [Nocardia paucivorans]